MGIDAGHLIHDAAALEALYGPPAERSIIKEVDHITADYRALIEASPFCVLATAGPDGLDASPRGDPAGFVVIEDEHTLLMPDRRGNNRADSLRNIVADGRVGLLFLIPGVGDAMRVNGTAVLSTDPALLQRFEVRGQLPRSVIVITVQTAFFHCPRAIMRSDLWNPDKYVTRSALPSQGQMLSNLSECRLGGEQWDRDNPARYQATLY